MNKRPVRVFCKLAIFWVTMEFGANFTVRAPKRRSDDQSSKILAENDDSKAFDSILQICHRFLRNGVQQEF